jgi:hypothetical protein
VREAATREQRGRLICLAGDGDGAWYWRLAALLAAAVADVEVAPLLATTVHGVAETD